MPERLGRHGTLVHKEHMRQLRLQRGVVTDYSYMGERLAQLIARSLPSEACSGLISSSTAQTEAWLVPEPDTGLVKVEQQDFSARWHLCKKETKPLSHGRRLPETERHATWVSLLHPLLRRNCHADRKRVPFCGPQIASRPQDRVVVFRDHQTGLALHSLHWQHIFRWLPTQSQAPVPSKSLHPLLRSGAAGRPP